MTYHSPTLEYGHSLGEAIIGGYVYRGTTYAKQLRGLYVYGDFESGRVWVYGRGVSRQVARSVPSGSPRSARARAARSLPSLSTAVCMP